MKISKFVFQAFKIDMKYFIITLLGMFMLISCNEKTKQITPIKQPISKDSLVRIIHDKWKFTVTLNNPKVSQNLSNWEDWRNYVNELTISPNASLDHLKRKAQNLVSSTTVLKNSIPEKYNKQETKARLAVLLTNVQNLDMLLELEPLNVKEITKLITNIQKNTNSIINQFNEFEIKSQIPRELGEDQLIQPIDTIKRATLNAIPKE